MKKNSLVLASAFSFLFFSGCSKAPQQMIDETKSLLDQAKVKSANVYCKEQFDSAQFLFNQCLADTMDQDKKLPFLRDYSKAIQMITNSQKAALNTINNIELGKEKLKAEVNANIAATNMMIESVNIRIEDAKSKGMAINAWVNVIDSARVILVAAKDILGKGDLIPAKEKSVSAKAMVISVKQDIEVLVAPSAK